ncbi:MAG: ATP phosphoribosyltransferase [Dehalococcoidia bacterium]|nr:ATP phosphoribosyltransferase [Dehalococcoidia bacterium]
MIRLALPAGDLRRDSAVFLDNAGFGSAEYSSGARTYRPTADVPGAVSFRVFRDRDIPIQVALGNYDAGICTSVSVDELLVRFPNEAVIKLAGLPFAYAEVLALAPGGIPGDGSTVRIASEYPNLAEAFALNQRLPRFSILAVNGSALDYPPEDADIAVAPISSEEEIKTRGLHVVGGVSGSSACLIANRDALGSSDLSALLSSLPRERQPIPAVRTPGHSRAAPPAPPSERQTVRLALPDGHQQREAPEICRGAGIELEGYEEKQAVARPRARSDELEVKVIRPQDMPQMVALGAFDLAVTGRDCLLNHAAQFPSTPAEEVADLERQRYRWAAVGTGALGASDLGDALRTWQRGGQDVIRIASEYPNLADHFARERRLGRYRVIPVVGASEGFVPEDAELLIEGSETGRTWEANNLVPLEWLFESTMILVAHRDRAQGSHAAAIEDLIQRFTRAAV